MAGEGNEGAHRRADQGAADKEIRVFLTTVPTEEKALTIARELVTRRLAACVNVVPHLTSFYRWKGEVQQDREVLLILKTTGAQFVAIEALYKELHPYEVPELIGWSIANGNGSYVDWVRKETK